MITYVSVEYVETTDWDQAKGTESGGATKKGRRNQVPSIHREEIFIEMTIYLNLLIYKLRVLRSYHIYTFWETGMIYGYDFKA